MDRQNLSCPAHVGQNHIPHRYAPQSFDAPVSHRNIFRILQRLRMSGGHVNNHTLQFTARYALEGISHLLVVRALDEGRPHAPDKRHEVLPRGLILFPTLDFKKKFDSRRSLIHGKSGQFLKKLAIGYAERHAVIPELFM